MSDCSLRPAVQADSPGIWALWRACAACDSCLWNDDYPTQAFLQDDLANHRLFMCESDGRLIGTVTLMKTDDLEEYGFPFEIRENVSVMTRLCIQPELQRQGYGAKLLALAEEQARAMGAKTVHLLCDVRNEPALALYSRAGYRRVCEARLYGDHFWVHEKSLFTRAQL